MDEMQMGAYALGMLIRWFFISLCVGFVLAVPVGVYLVLR